ncbi:hypothetical protein PYW08_003012 [Mythimna loreyi]|uniref:Uncharacterized protein n=1 Tax=Mythimna loreyi TaxID=667449 RepID=A0ACC2QU54_9NEOP|nr:hypothetical protein PYW08_003012 [Mythimna loreyi]
MFKLLVLSCLLVGCLAEPFLFPSWLSEAGRSFRRGCADRAEGWRACARLEDSSALAPHGYDCGAFFYCSGLGRPVCRRCPAGLHFSPELQVCDWPSNVHCNPTTSYPTTTEDSSTTVTDSSTKPDEYYTTDSISTTTLEESSTFESTTSTPFEESSTFESTTSTPFEESSTFESTTSIPFEESSTFESTTSTPFEEYSTTEVLYT